MSIKALLATLILGTSSVALAHGAPQTREPERISHVTRTPVRPIEHPIVRPVRDYRPIVERPIVRPIIRESIRPIFRPVVRDTVVYENAPAPTIVLSPFAATGSTYLALGDQAGTGIELTSNGGSAFVKSVLIQYADGTTQLEQVGMALDGANPALDLATNGAPVAGVTVYGSGCGLAAAMY
ncbi:MAG TPA: hypothetical protein VLX92_04625 [Kofleriaceae bacterium]|nr:hypothetical protein [Kofleriaceae bacterium]